MYLRFFMLLLASLPGIFQPLLAQTPLRVAVVGLVHTHVHWILGREKQSDIEIVAIVEPNRDLAERYAQQHGYDMDLVYADLETMLNEVKPEAVTAFGTILDHLAVVKACAPRGIHVMVEKPLAISHDHARQMADLAEKHQIHLLTNYETTWYGSHAEIFRLLNRDQTLGPLRKVVVHDGHPGPKEIGVNEEFLVWLTDPKYNGAGALTDFGCYGANLITWLAAGKRPLSVMALTQQLKPEIYPLVDDEATILLEYDGFQGIIQASWNWPVSRKDLEVYGQKGQAFALNRSDVRVRLGDGAPEVSSAGAPLRPPYHDPFAYFAAVVRGQIQPGPYDLSSLENNLLVMEILDAARKSARTGKRIRLK